MSQKTLKWQELRGFPVNEADDSSRARLYRAAVPGGWLIGFSEYCGDGGVGGVTFMPDPQHAWDGGSVDVD